MSACACKVNANREQSHQSCLRGYAEVQLNLCKVNKKKVQRTTPPLLRIKIQIF